MDRKPSTFAVNGRLWGVRAKDWAEIQEPQFRELYVKVFDHLRLGEGTKYLDLGCASGVALQIAAGRGARVAGLDAAEALLAIARRREPRADLRTGDLQDLPFGNAEFDVATGFNSFQYAADPTAALREAGRVVKRGGRVVVGTWGDPTGMPVASVIASLKSLLPAAPAGAPGPFSLSNEAALRKFAEDAGLKPLEVLDIAGAFRFADEQKALRGWNSAGIAAKAMELVGEKAVTEAHARAIAPFRQADGSYVIEARYRCLVATTGE